jgi:hypothetical protein
MLEDNSRLDPDQVRNVEILHQPPGREHVRVTVEYATGEMRVFTVHKSLLATVLEKLYTMEKQH